VLEGAKIPFLDGPLKPGDTAFNVLGTAVIRSILQHYVPVLMQAEGQAPAKGAIKDACIITLSPGNSVAKRRFPGARGSGNGNAFVCL
jgi:hypothetical protein